MWHRRNVWPRVAFAMAVFGIGAPGHAEPAGPAVQPTHAGVSYGEHERQTLDLYLADARPAAVAVFIHGGAFVRGDKAGIAAAPIERLRARGIHVASINYRYSTQAAYPAPMHDAAQAVQFLRRHAGRYGIDPRRVAAWGESAGGGIALWLTLHDDLAEPDSSAPQRQQSTRLSAAVGILAQSTYDPAATNALFPGVRAESARMYQLLFGCETAACLRDPSRRAAFADASPVTHAGPGDPPIFLVYKPDDEPVPADAPLNVWVHHRRHGEALAEKLAAAGVPYALQLGGVVQSSSGVEEPGDYIDFLIARLAAPPSAKEIP